MSLRGLVPKPIEATWTDEQWSAITARGENLLVAAAAGSGKTAVLVERLIRMVGDTQDPIDVDRLLVATFTKAASEEMRHRIRDALEKKLPSDPSNEHIARQLALLPRAAITTLHSFCMDIVRRNFVEVGLDPNFRIGNEIELTLMRNDVLETVLESYYDNADPQFFRFIDAFTSDRSDAKIYKLVLDLYEFAQSHPWPEHWMREAMQPFKQAAISQYSIEQRLEKWLEILFQSLQLEIQSCREDLKLALAISSQEPGLAAFVPKLTDEIAMLDPLLEAAFNEDWQRCTDVIRNLPWTPKMPGIKKDECDVAVKERVAKIRKAAKDNIGRIATNWFGRSPEQHVMDVVQVIPVLDVLLVLTMDFAKAFRAEKREKALVDFSDLEHFALAILRDKQSSPEQLIPSAVALTYQARFEEVLLDEYQDTNQVQEAIVQLLSKRSPGNRFMVGDVKQSIYRFRLAEPNLFLKKYNDYQKIQHVTDEADGVRIDLARNFRSRQQVVDGINFLFRQLMQPEVAEIDYDEAAELKLGATYPDAAHACEVVLIEHDAEEETDVSFDSDDDSNDESATEHNQQEQENLSKVQKEARYVASRIRKMVDSGFQVYDGKLKQNRALHYRDIVILLRATSSAAPVFEEELRAAGVASYAELNSGYFNAVEVQTVLSLLQIIDNPQQDIALAAVLRSPLYGLTAEQLAHIRLADRKGSFYDALRSAAEQDAQLTDMLGQLERWRDDARSMPLSNFLWALLNETGYFDGVGGWPGGVQRQANLRALIERAKQFEASSYRGLFRFLRFIERLQESGSDLGTAQAIGEREDVVRIMSIHKSKGLEFPVVFLAGVSKKFNETDMRQPFMMHRDLGYGPKAIDAERRISYPTIAHQAIGEKLRKEMLAEEMRILYVALTRAKEKLIIVGSINDAAKTLENWTRYLSVEPLSLPQASLFKAKTYLDWIGPALIRHPDARLWREHVGATATNLRSEDPSQWQMAIIRETAIAQSTDMLQVDPTYLHAIRDAKPLPVDEPIDATIAHQLTWEDPLRAATQTFAKISVSELKRKTEDPTPGEERPPQPMQVELNRPSFMQTQQLTATERGTAYHTVMQHLPLQNPDLNVAAFLDGLVDKQFLTQAQRDAIHADRIGAFLRTALYQEMSAAQTVYRELPFSLGIADANSTKPILMQGVIDCLYDWNGELVLLDYKTDRVSRPEEIGERYRAQLELYADAITKMTGRPVARRLLYLFDGGHIVTI